jgi:hypothetical protein
LATNYKCERLAFRRLPRRGNRSSRKSLSTRHETEDEADRRSTYRLAPYRLATVAGGCFVAFIWTIFPKPLTDRTWLRRDLSAALYLLANYFGAVTSTVRSQIDGTAGNPEIPHSPAYELQKIRRKIFGKMMLLLPSMAAHAQWQRWEPTIGGRFPREAYEDIIMRTTRIMSYLTFMSYTMNHPPTDHLDALRGRPDLVSPQQTRPPSEASLAAGAADDDATAPPGSSSAAAAEANTTDRDWLNALSSVLRDISPSHHNIVSTLMLLSNALFSGHSLPPFLPLPRPYEMTRALLRLSRTTTSPTTSHGNDLYTNNSDDDDDDDDDADLSPLRVIDSRTGAVVDGSYRPSRHRRRGGGGTVGLGLAGLAGVGRQHVLDPENVEKPGYAEFAVLEICSTLVCDDLEGLIRSIGGLVGVVDFSYRVSGSDSTLVESEKGGGRGRGKGKVD